MEVWSPYPFLYVSSRIVMWECSACTHILTSSGWNFISSSHALLHHCLGMLDETVAFISLFRHHDCFLQSHLFLSSFPSCHQSASFVHRFCFLFFFSHCTELCMVFYSICSYSECICKPLEYAFLNPLYVFWIQLFVVLKIFVIWAARKSFSRDFSLFTFCNVQTVGCHGTCSKSMLSLRVL